MALRAPVRRLAVPDVPIPYSRPLEQFVIPQVDSIAAQVRALVQHQPVSYSLKREAA